MRGINANGRNTVQGTFDDLSEEEKTRAYLQFLQYHQQLEKENETKQFQQMLNNKGDFSPIMEDTQKAAEDSFQKGKASKIQNTLIVTIIVGFHFF